MVRTPTAKLSAKKDRPIPARQASTTVREPKRSARTPPGSAPIPKSA
jgi:hypothetical protein